VCVKSSRRRQTVTHLATRSPLLKPPLPCSSFMPPPPCWLAAASLRLLLHRPARWIRHSTWRPLDLLHGVPARPLLAHELLLKEHGIHGHAGGPEPHSAGIHALGGERIIHLARRCRGQQRGGERECMCVYVCVLVNSTVGDEVEGKRRKECVGLLRALTHAWNRHARDAGWPDCTRGCEARSWPRHCHAFTLLLDLLPGHDVDLQASMHGTV
jgi:hypothetical protein